MARVVEGVRNSNDHVPACCARNHSKDGGSVDDGVEALFPKDQRAKPVRAGGRNLTHLHHDHPSTAAGRNRKVLAEPRTDGPEPLGGNHSGSAAAREAARHRRSTPARSEQNIVSMVSGASSVKLRPSIGESGPLSTNSGPWDSSALALSSSSFFVYVMYDWKRRQRVPAQLRICPGNSGLVAIDVHCPTANGGEQTLVQAIGLPQRSPGFEGQRQALGAGHGSGLVEGGLRRPKWIQLVAGRPRRGQCHEHADQPERRLGPPIAAPRQRDEGHGGGHEPH